MSTGLDVSQVRLLVVRPALEDLGAWSAGAEALVLGTAAHESAGFRFLHQLGKGPAVGLFQMEPATYFDHWRWLESRPGLAQALRRMTSADQAGERPAPDPAEMAWNLRLAAAMCRVHYLRQPFAVPEPSDVAGLARVWKRYYNTPAGAGLEGQFIANYRNFVAPVLGV